MKITIKRFVSMIMAAVLTAALFTGCGSSEASSADPSAAGTEDSGKKENAEISYWTTTNRKDWTEAAIAEFAKSHPEVKIVATYDQADTMKTNLKVSASSGTLPDMWYSWGGSFSGFFSANGMAYDLTAYAGENDWNSRLDQKLLALCTSNGVLEGYPQVLNAFGFIYRNDIFKEYGIAVPQTFADFEKALATLKQNGITPIALGGQKGWQVQRLVDALIEMYAGPELHDQMLSLEAGWDNEAMVKAYAKLKEWNDAGYFPEGFVTSEPNDARQLLYNRVSAMILDAAPLSQMILSNGVDPSLFSSFAVPYDRDDARSPSYATMLQFNANLSEEKLDQAVAFSDFTLDKTASFADQIAYPLPLQGLEFPEEYPLIVPLQEEFSDKGGFVTSDNALEPEAATVLYQANEAIIGGTMTPEEAAAFVQKNLSEAGTASK